MGINFDQEINNNVIEEVCHRFNERLVFKPDEQSLILIWALGFW